MKRTEAIKNFLRDHAHQDLARLYEPEMEVQVMVSPDNGEKVINEKSGKTFITYTDGLQTWRDFRIPWSDGTYTDSDIQFSLQHAKSIGLSGWDFSNKLSRWLVYDFDAMVGHSARHMKKLTDAQLNDVCAKAEQIPWVTVRRSTSGKGLHLYVFLDLVHTPTRAHHAALARAVLEEMSLLCNYPFNLSVDVCGGMAWVWADRQNEDSFELIKDATELCPEPTNWERHLDVAKRKKTHAYDDSIRDVVLYKDLIDLDDKHLELLNWLRTNDCYHYWDAEVSMLVTHTVHLKKAHEALEMQGLFDTSSEGTDLEEQNCFAYTLTDGAWAVYRYSEGTAEHPYWNQDGKGWTYIYLNKLPSVIQLCRQFEGVEDEKGNYHLRGKKFESFLNVFGEELYEGFSGRGGMVAELGPGRVLLEVEKRDDDQPIGWLSKGKKWRRVIHVSQAHAPQLNTDVVVRHLIASGMDGGWSYLIDGRWIDEPVSNITLGLAAQNYSNKQIKALLGQAVNRPWTLVSRPFEDEYLGNRVWNRGASKFRFIPKEGVYPTWRGILDHVGGALTPELEKNPWFKANGIYNGGDYLFAWVAAMIQNPYDSLPYLFIYSERQLTGKSMFHESLSLLFDPGVVRAENALKSAFNGELEGAVLCVLEETDLQKDLQAYNKIKDLVTGRQLSLHVKMKTPRMLPNTSHWVHTANSLSFCPVFSGDSRITVIQVPSPPKKIMPRRKMMEQLEAEGPAFLDALLRYVIPEQQDRLMLPVVSTEEKQIAMQQGVSALDRFVQETVVESPGSLIKYSDFQAAFELTLDITEKPFWSRYKISQELKVLRGKVPNQGNGMFLANVKFATDPEPEDAAPWSLHGNTLKR